MNRRWSSKVCLKRLGLISTSTLDVVIETSLVSPAETKQVRKVDLNWTCRFLFTREQNGTILYRFCSHENGTVRYRIVPISGSFFRTAQFLDLFWNGPLYFFRTLVNATPLRTTFRNGPKWNGTISYLCEQGLILLNWYN